MGKMNKHWYRDQAIERYRHANMTDLTKPCIEIPKDADVSNGTQPGAWVQAWIYIPDPAAEQQTSEETKTPDDLEKQLESLKTVNKALQEAGIRQ